jgi:hypothetical protein
LRCEVKRVVKLTTIVGDGDGVEDEHDLVREEGKVVHGRHTRPLIPRPALQLTHNKARERQHGTTDRGRSLTAPTAPVCVWTELTVRRVLLPMTF